MSNLIYKNQKGMVLPLGLMFLAIIAILGMTAVIVTTTDLRIGTNYKLSQQAFYAADAGISRAMSRIEDFIFDGTEILPATDVRVDPISISYMATYDYQATRRLGPLRPRPGHEEGVWAGVGYDLAATGQSGRAQSRIEMLSRATVPIDAYPGGK